VPLGLRVTAEAKRKLEEAAIKSGRSISQEAELRIERSFDDDRLAEIAEGLKTFQVEVQRWLVLDPLKTREGLLSEKEIRQIQEKRSKSGARSGRHRLKKGDRS
jgi:hypothetical protein